MLEPDDHAKAGFVTERVTRSMLVPRALMGVTIEVVGMDTR